jgi:hypothetical protein
VIVNSVFYCDRIKFSNKGNVEYIIQLTCALISFYFFYDVMVLQLCVIYQNVMVEDCHHCRLFVVCLHYSDYFVNLDLMALVVTLNFATKIH